MKSKFVVLKFGGTSVASAERWASIAETANQRIEAGYTPILVCSALAGISNQLDTLLDAALEDRHRPILEQVIAQHKALALSLAIDVDWLDGALSPLRRLADGAALIGEATPRMKAAAMAMGELLSTQIGARFMSAQGIPVTWIDARDHLEAAPNRGDAAWLSAHCDDGFCAATQDAFSKHDCLITQGFIARNEHGETVLLGRGGSDTSAALFAAKLNAERCEIWTDVPGVYTANPRDIPDARMLKLLGYDEAQEIASAGASVLHPRCLAPVRRHGIPLHVRCTQRPDLVGTIIGPNAPDTAEVKVISARRGITLVSMEALGMWQSVGFLADVFTCFKKHGISVDLVSTSETNITASFDQITNVIVESTLDALISDLRSHCQVKVVRDCASVSLVGRHIRAILHQLGPALQVFESQKIHMLSQAASDLNLTFVVDASQADRLVGKLHGLLFGDETASPHLGPTWRETFDDKKHLGVDDTPWWSSHRDTLLALSQTSTPAFVYHRASIDRAASSLLVLDAVNRVFYAVKANDNPDILARLADSAMGFECVSVGELEHVWRCIPDLDPQRVLFTPNFAPRSEYEYALAKNVYVTVDSTFPLENWPEIFEGRDILLRLDPGRGRGHHAYVRTAGPQSKFGIAPDDLQQAADAVDAAGAKVIGLHAHAGSGIRTPDAWTHTAHFLVDARRYFPDVQILDLGGGLGVVERPGRAPLDLQKMGDLLARFKTLHPELELWLEPGRYVVAQAGVLLTRVVQTKNKGDVHYVGVDAGMHTFLRPALYGAWHEIANLSKHGAPLAREYNVVGPICETGDTLGYGRILPETSADDILLLATAGAYGRTMSSDYNRRVRAAEHLI
ncbi:MAG: bifunctional aspartate kinase/diaminopimelate decarboxylase [Myxococcota bacterium]|nr:bifunctional aspartate kinase/diaminopimelate decarboxylase [Myxococcota bacterium]